MNPINFAKLQELLEKSSLLLEEGAKLLPKPGECKTGVSLQLLQDYNRIQSKTLALQLKIGKKVKMKPLNTLD